MVQPTPLALAENLIQHHRQTRPGPCQPVAHDRLAGPEVVVAQISVGGKLVGGRDRGVMGL